MLLSFTDRYFIFLLILLYYSTKWNVFFLTCLSPPEQAFPVKHMPRTLPQSLESGKECRQTTSAPSSRLLWKTARTDQAWWYLILQEISQNMLECYEGDGFYTGLREQQSYPRCQQLQWRRKETTRQLQMLWNETAVCHVKEMEVTMWKKTWFCWLIRARGQTICCIYWQENDLFSFN